MTFESIAEAEVLRVLVGFVDNVGDAAGDGEERITGTRFEF
jgi:hypothetical protein